MSLRIWLPLIDNINNFGLDTVTSVNSGTTLNTFGKLGKYFHGTATTHQITFTDANLTNIISGAGKKYSCSFWAKPTLISGWSFKIGSNVGLWWGANTSRWVWNDSDSGKRITSIENSEDTTNWHHYVAVIDKSNLSKIQYTFYTDGVQSNAWTDFDGSSYTQATGTTLVYTPYYGYVTDFRLYDHLLSIQEIQEISKGLVLHLPLNNNGLGNENLIINNSMAPISGTTNWSYAGTDWSISNVTSLGASRGHAIRATYAGTAQQAGGIHHPTGNTKGDLTNGAVYTLSARLRASKNCTVRFHNELQATNYINVTTNWKVYSYSSTINNDNTYHSNICYVAAAEATQNMWIECDWIKLEEGNKATPYSPNPMDQLYPDFGPGIPQNLLSGTPKSTSPTAYNFSQLNLLENLQAGKTYTLQLWNVNVSHSAKTVDQTGVWVYWGGGSVNLFNWAGSTYFTDGHADYLSKTFTITESHARGNGSANKWLNLYNSVPSVAGTLSATIGQWKLEESSTASAYIPARTDAAYKAEGYNDKVVFDQSGYNYNAVKYGDITYSSDSPKYNVSTVFAASGTNYINLGTQLYNVRDAMTVSLWAKANDWTSTSKGTPFSSVEAGGFGWQVSGANYVFYCGTGTSSNTYANSTVTVNNLSAGWHMLSATYDGLVLKTYIDGVLATTLTKYTTKTPIYYNNNSAMFISGESASSLTAPNGGIFRGSVSDVRIYATALSAQAVKSLYNNGAYIDTNNNIYGKIRD